MKARVLTQLSCCKCSQGQSAWLGSWITIRDGGERRVRGVKGLGSWVYVSVLLPVSFLLTSSVIKRDVG